MQTFAALIDPVARHRAGIFGKDSGIFHHALLESYTVAVLEVNGGYDQHDYFNTFN